MGNDYPPYREACQNKPLPTCGLGPLNKHGKKSESGIDKYVNTTLVPNWNLDVGGNIQPYERWTADTSGASESCETHIAGNGGPYGGGWSLPYPANTFHHTDGDKVDLKVCHKRGFKNVQARRNWNGRFGYKDIEASNGVDTWITCDGALLTAYRSNKAAPLRTKYQRIDVSSTWQNKSYDYSGGGDPVITTIDQSASVTEVIDAGGILNPTAFSAMPNASGSLAQLAVAALAIGFRHWGDIVNFVVTTVTVTGRTVTWTPTSITVTNDSDGATVEAVNWDVAAGTFTRVVTDYNGGAGWVNTLNESYAVTDTTLVYSREVISWDTPGENVIGRVTTTASGTLSVPVTDADIYADLKALLNEWNLADDKQYPWRTDLKPSLAPLVSRDELSTQEFDSIGFYLRDYGVPVADDFGGVFGDPDWVGDTGYTINPNPQTGTYRTAIDFPGHNSGATVDIQVTPNFSQSDAPVTYSVIGGSFPPGVSMDASGHITGTIGDDGHYGVTIEATCGVAAATGAIRGAPNPAGYQNYFDFAFTDVRGCCYRPIGPPGPGFTAWDWYAVGYGMFLGDAGGFDGFNTTSACNIPLNATQWNNWFQAVNKPVGAWIFYADKADYFPADCLPSTDGAHSGAGDAGAFVAQKWAECLEPWKSQNFARPAGDDKFGYDENRVYCVTNVEGAGAGSTWNVSQGIPVADADGNDPSSPDWKPTFGSAAPPDGTDFSGYWGGPSVNGFYNVSGYSGGVLTLGAKAFDVPSNWHSRSNGDDATCFGKLRFPTAPSLLGRIPVMPDIAGTTFTFGSAQPNFGMASATHQEPIDLYDETFTLLASNITATRVDDTHFTVAAGDAQPTARWVQIHGAAKWYMNDGTPKGDYVHLTWNSDFRSKGEYGRLTGVVDCGGTQVARPATNAGGGDVNNAFSSFSQEAACLPFTQCSPRVVCFSPNGETWENGTTHDFPETFVADDAYGSKWWGYVQQTMTDLLWQQPHRPCNIESCARWVMDDGTCHENAPGSCPGDEDYVEGESVPPVYYYAFTPLVEARITVPNNYGVGQDESAPAVPAGIQIGWNSPVTHAFGDGDVALPPEPQKQESDSGRPGNVNGPWTYHAFLCESVAGGCAFDYSTPGCAD